MSARMAPGKQRRDVGQPHLLLLEHVHRRLGQSRLLPCDNEPHFYNLQGIAAATKWITLIGCSISVVCLAVMALVLLGLEKIRKRGGSVIRANICINLMMAELILLAGLDATSNKLACAFIAAFLHYFFMATFTWSALESLNLYLALVKVFGAQKSPSLHYYAAGYGVPIILVAISLAATQGGGYGTASYCWLDSSNGLIWAFTAPLSCILMMNLVVFGLVLRVLWVQGRADAGLQLGRKNVSVQATGQHSYNAKQVQRRAITKKIYGSLASFFFLGLTWLTGFMYMSEAATWAACLIHFFNSVVQTKQ